MPQIRPASENKRLNVFVGKWNTKGKTIARPDSPAIEICGTDAYEWLPGRFFLIHRVDVRMGEEKVDTIEIIGSYDASSKTFPMRSFDHLGNNGLMHASLSKDGVWTLTGKSMRATLVVSVDGNMMTAKWEKMSDSSEWKHWMDLMLTKTR